MSELRGLFDEEEWRSLQYTPFWVFQAIVGAKGSTEAAESAILETFLRNAQGIEEPLLAEVVASVAADLERVRGGVIADPRPVEDAFPEVRALLDRRVERERADEFKDALLGLAYAIANASGPGFLDLGDRVSKEESSAFIHLADLLGVPPREVG